MNTRERFLSTNSEDSILEISFFIRPADRESILAELNRIGIDSVSDGKLFPRGMVSDAWVNRVKLAESQLCVNCNHYNQQHILGTGPEINDVASDVCWGLRSDNNTCKCKKFIVKPS